MKISFQQLKRNHAEKKIKFMREKYDWDQKELSKTR